MTAAAEVARVRELVAQLDVSATPADVNQATDEIRAIFDRCPEARDYLANHRADLIDQLDRAKVQIAINSAKRGFLSLAMEAAAPPRPRTGEGDDRPRLRPPSGPAAERRLHAMQMLESVADIVPTGWAAEAALDRGALAIPREGVAVMRAFDQLVGLLRTGAMYLLHGREAEAALATDPPAMDVLPPLPFPRVWIESCGDYNEPVPFAVLASGGGDQREVLVFGVGIVETDPGRGWDVFLPLRFPDGPEWSVLGLHVSPTGIEWLLVEDDEDRNGWRRAADVAWLLVRKLAIGAVHLIAARNVPHDPVRLPRAQRKRIQRSPLGQGWTVGDRIYYVNLTASGERAEGTGDGGRVYGVRWLVSGHWRHLDHGRARCTCCTPPRAARWIHPYVKGPAGAPWKGRQVRVPGAPTEARA